MLLTLLKSYDNYCYREPLQKEELVKCRWAEEVTQVCTLYNKPCIVYLYTCNIRYALYTF